MGFISNIFFCSFLSMQSHLYYSKDVLEVEKEVFVQRSLNIVIVAAIRY